MNVYFITFGFSLMLLVFCFLKVFCCSNSARFGHLELFPLAPTSLCQVSINIEVGFVAIVALIFFLLLQKDSGSS